MSNSQSSTAISSPSEFLAKYFPKKAESLRLSQTKEPYELGVELATEALDSVSLSMAGSFAKAKTNG